MRLLHFNSQMHVAWYNFQINQPVLLRQPINGILVTQVADQIILLPAPVHLINLVNVETIWFALLPTQQDVPIPHVN